MKKEKDIKSVLCIPDVGKKWMRSFLKVVLSKEDLDTSELMMKNVKPVDPEVSIDLFNKMIKKCRKRIIAVSVQLIVENKPGTHANMLILDTKKKTVELFEPHGKRSEQTTMDSLEGAYNISDKLFVFECTFKVYASCTIISTFYIFKSKNFNNVILCRLSGSCEINKKHSGNSLVDVL